MDEKNNGARRRKAFSDFKENQYDDSFSLNPSQKNKKTVKKVLTIILIVVLTVVFIILGFCFTDSLIKISKQPYEDKSTYTAAHVTPPSPPAVLPGEEETTQPPTSASSQQSETVTSQSEYYADADYQNQVMENY